MYRSLVDAFIIFGNFVFFWSRIFEYLHALILKLSQRIRVIVNGVL